MSALGHKASQQALENVDLGIERDEGLLALVRRMGFFLLYGRRMLVWSLCLESGTLLCSLHIVTAHRSTEIRCFYHATFLFSVHCKPLLAGNSKSISHKTKSPFPLI
jgi:hypothetical protein